jgi:4-amino-4-deoxy-L-arabinose transferase-like glycosyltransferase
VDKSKTPALPPQRISERFMLLAGILIGYGLVIVALDVTVFATPIWDAFAIWQFKAKVLALAPLYPPPAYFYDVRLSFSHLRYPLLLPMICAGIQVANHSFREGLGKIPCYLFYIGMGACIWGLVRRCRGRTAAIIAAGLVLTLPVIYRFGGSGTAEMALTAFYAVSIIAILRWQQNQRWGDLLLAALASAAMAWTKNEGQALALINGLVILVLTPRPLGRRNLLAVAAFAAIVVVLFLPWLLFIRGLPRTDEDYAARLNLHEMATHLDRVPDIALAMLREFVSIKDWGIFWIILLALALLPGARIRSRAILTLWVLLALQILAYFPPYMVTIWTLNPLLVLTIDRMLMHMAPAAALLIGLLWPATLAPDCDLK